MPKMHGVASKSRSTSIGVILANARHKQGVVPASVRDPVTPHHHREATDALPSTLPRGPRGPPEATGLVPRAKL